MCVDRDCSSDLEDWQDDIRRGVRETVKTRSIPVNRDISSPYSRTSGPGSSPVLVCIAGCCFDDEESTALDVAVALELSRFHLQTHIDLGTTHDDCEREKLLAGDLYRSLADQVLVSIDRPPTQVVSVLGLLSETVLDATEALASGDFRTVDWLLAGGAIRLSLELFDLDPPVSSALESYGDSVRASRGWPDEYDPAVISSLPASDCRSGLAESATSHNDSYSK